MDYEETMVEEDFDNTEVDDTLPDGIVEEDESEEDDEFIEEDFESDEEDGEEVEEEPDEEPEEDEEVAPPPSEPGWIKQRINKAVSKAVAQALAEQAKQFEAQMKPIRERLMEEEAQDLLRSRKVGDIETARELVRLRQGQPASDSQREPQPRNENGQFTSREQIAQQARNEARVDELYSQAQKIKARGGPDVIKEFTQNEDIKRRVVSGELNFYDVAEMMRKSGKKRPPSPTRSSNGASKVTTNAFNNMSDKQFERFEKGLDEGKRYSIK